MLRTYSSSFSLNVFFLSPRTSCLKLWNVDYLGDLDVPQQEARDFSKFSLRRPNASSQLSNMLNFPKCTLQKKKETVLSKMLAKILSDFPSTTSARKKRKKCRAHRQKQPTRFAKVSCFFCNLFWTLRPPFTSKEKSKSQRHAAWAHCTEGKR